MRINRTFNANCQTKKKGNRFWNEYFGTKLSNDNKLKIMKKERVEFLKELKAYGIKENIPNVSETNGKFLHFLVRSLQAKTVLEIGMANGYSTIYLADAVEQVDGKVVCYEIAETGWRAAEKNFKAIGLEDRIEIRKTSVLKEPPEAGERFDFIFVDAQKSLYHEFWEVVKKHMHKNTVVVFDDVLKFSEKTAPFHALMETEIDFEWVILPMDGDDGVMLIQHRAFDL